MRIKKGSALLLSSAMVLSLFQGIGGTTTVQAAENTLPTSGYYASWENLREFSLGKNDTVHKLIFGQNGSGSAQEWKIAGDDPDNDGQNIILLAATPFTYDEFDTNKTTKAYASNSGCNYYEETPSQVNPNHYGTSKLRSTLNAYVNDTDYFSSAEVSKMLTTELKNKDTCNNTYYYVGDKLYVAYGELGATDNVYVGTNHSTQDLKGNVAISLANYFPSSLRTWDCVWLRTPGTLDVAYALMYSQSQGDVSIADVYDKGSYDDGYRYIVPAFDLDLDVGSFASAAKAASSEGFTANSSMTENTYTLRYNSTGIEKAVINPEGTQIKLTNASGKYLMVQNSTGVYAMEIDSNSVTVNASDITMGDSALTNFNNCKVWVESTDAGRITTAKRATQDTAINSVVISGIDNPMVGCEFDTAANTSGTTGLKDSVVGVAWKQGSTGVSGTAGYNTAYTACVTLTAAEGYVFASNVSATVNGSNASVTKNTDGTLTVSYTFAATEKDRLVSITQPQAITVANGTAYSDMNLPTKVGIVTTGGTVTEADVEWNTQTPVSGSYDPTDLAEQNVQLKGKVTCPASIDANGVELTTSIAITISTAGVTGAPTASLQPGTYIANQSLTLTSSTAGADIYYTTDGTEPALDLEGNPRGTTLKYTGEIQLTGTEGETVKTTIKAIAMSDKMWDSDVQTFEYTISIPVPGKVEVEDKQDENFGAGALKGSGEEVRNAVLTEDDKKAIAEGKDVSIWVEVKDQSTTVSDSDKTTIDKALTSDDWKVGTYLDICLWKTIEGTTSTTVSEIANGSLQISFTIPEDLQKSGRTYQIVRIHNGVADILDATVDENYELTFATDRFSTYALAYTDSDSAAKNVTTTNNKINTTPSSTTQTTTTSSTTTTPSQAGTASPKTGDTSNMALYLVILMLGVAGIVVVVFRRKRQ